MSLEELDGLVRVMDENRLTEVTVQEGDRKIAIKRRSNGAAGPGVSGGNSSPETMDSGGLTAITSPAVGIFYGSPVPGEPPFVSEGRVIEPEQVVALIETLKVMSEIRSAIHGRVLSVEVTDGDLVEFGQTLIICEEIE